MKNYKEECADCFCLVSMDGMWFCDEVQKFCKDAVCPYMKEK